MGGSLPAAPACVFFFFVAVFKEVSVCKVLGSG